MDRSPNSLEEVQVGGIARIADRNAAPWQRQQQLQRWKTHMQRLGQAIESGDLGQARYEFEALMNDVPEAGQADPVAHPQFAFLGKALLSLDLVAAREAFSRLQNELPSLHHRQHQHEEHHTQDLPAGDTPSTLDVTA